MLLPWLILSIWLVAHAVDADTPETFFIDPPSPSTGSLYIGDPLLELNSQFTVRWSTNLTTYGIYLWQQDLDSQTANVDTNSIYTVASGPTGEASFDWTVSPGDFILETSPVFFFTIGTGPTLTNAFTCHYFNITTQALTTTSSTTALSTSTSTSATATSEGTTSSTTTTLSTTSTAPPTTSSPPTAIPSAASAAPTASKRDDGLAIGLGVGLGLAALLAAFLGYTVLKRRALNRKQNQFDGMNMGHPNGLVYPIQSNPQSWDPFTRQRYQLYEMDSRDKLAADRSGLAELPGPNDRG
ncbi:hypothetical protein PV04_00249 [Phialophora macrospora]|uniref:Mid2 domain-containing protein n=1 Tax=Phialophora macrospora TaxID=1851006 RepID=A0A0D2FZX9_9EURO|nr:hypothetical protein PV04_00249 [Phialophora macrospora]